MDAMFELFLKSIGPSVVAALCLMIILSFCSFFFTNVTVFAFFVAVPQGRGRSKDTLMRRLQGVAAVYDFRIPTMKVP